MSDSESISAASDDSLPPSPPSAYFRTDGEDSVVLGPAKKRIVDPLRFAELRKKRPKKPSTTTANSDTSDDSRIPSPSDHDFDNVRVDKRKVAQALAKSKQVKQMAPPPPKRGKKKVVAAKEPGRDPLHSSFDESLERAEIRKNMNMKEFAAKYGKPKSALNIPKSPTPISPPKETAMPKKTYGKKKKSSVELPASRSRQPTKTKFTRGRVPTLNDSDEEDEWTPKRDWNRNNKRVSSRSRNTELLNLPRPAEPEPAKASLSVSGRKKCSVSASQPSHVDSTSKNKRRKGNPAISRIGTLFNHIENLVSSPDLEPTPPLTQPPSKRVIRRTSLMGRTKENCSTTAQSLVSYQSQSIYGDILSQHLSQPNNPKQGEVVDVPLSQRVEEISPASSSPSVANQDPGDAGNSASSDEEVHSSSISPIPASSSAATHPQLDLILTTQPPSEALHSEVSTEDERPTAPAAQVEVVVSTLDHQEPAAVGPSSTTSTPKRASTRSRKEHEVVSPTRRSSSRKLAEVVAPVRRLSFRQEPEVVPPLQQASTRQQPEVVEPVPRSSTRKESEGVVASRQEAQVVSPERRSSTRQQPGVAEPRSSTRQQPEVVAPVRKSSTRQEPEVAEPVRKSSTRQQPEVVAPVRKSSTRQQPEVVAPVRKSSTRQQPEVVATVRKSSTRQQPEVVAPVPRSFTRKESEIVVAVRESASRQEPQVVSSKRQHQPSQPTSGLRASIKEPEIVAQSTSTEQADEVIVSRKRPSSRSQADPKNSTNVGQSSRNSRPTPIPSRSRQSTAEHQPEILSPGRASSSRNHSSSDEELSSQEDIQVARRKRFTWGQPAKSRGKVTKKQVPPVSLSSRNPSQITDPQPAVTSQRAEAATSQNNQRLDATSSSDEERPPPKKRGRQVAQVNRNSWGPNHPIMQGRGKVLYNKRLVSEDLIKETFAKYVPDTTLTGAQLKTLHGNMNKYIENTFNDLCDNTPLYFGVWTFQQLMTRLKRDGLLSKTATQKDFVALLKDTVGEEETSKCQGLLFPKRGETDTLGIFK